jgi:hypothetical protein
LTLGKIMFTRIVILTLGIVVPATAEIRLEGMMSGPKITLFALSNDGGQARWLRIGTLSVGATRIDHFNYGRS